MRADVITMRRIDAAESALFLGAALAGFGVAFASVATAILGAVIFGAACAWCWREVARDEVTRWDTPTSSAPGDGAHRDAPRNRRVVR